MAVAFFLVLARVREGCLVVLSFFLAGRIDDDELDVFLFLLGLFFLADDGLEEEVEDPGT